MAKALPPQLTAKQIAQPCPCKRKYEFIFSVERFALRALDANGPTKFAFGYCA
jgi:hypothetical protein